ncbi:hypothetical protein [Curtobacterium sp. BH-2-1-1]|uniref:hypothetical protein n=1 Tax=Curtobacterium sp. BH-2-1-1 TaxID=1905847 RepID=UPI0011A0BE94|nr:hypothetical protein [Curtobacterium sp. BH-2-1-1]
MSTKQVSKPEVESDPIEPLRERSRGFFAAHPLQVILLTGAVATILAAILVLTTEGLRPFDVIGFGATVWALLLALAIYLITSGDTDRLLRQSQELREQLETYSAPPQGKQTQQELNNGIYGEFKEHVKRLRAKYPMPLEAITYAGRPGPSGRGNRPVIFETQRGHRYSVYKGRYWSVQRLDDES